MSSKVRIGSVYLKIFAELQYQYVPRREVIQAAKEFGIPVNQAIKCRQRYLGECLQKLRAYLKDCYESLSYFPSWRIEYKLASYRADVTRQHITQVKMDICNLEMDFYKTDWGKRINQAKQIPIETILGVSSNRARQYHCPLHGDKNPSLKVYPDNTLHCFSCRKIHDGIDLLMERDGLDFKEAVRRLCDSKA